MRGIVFLCVLGAVPGLIGGLVFYVIHGDTTATRAIAYGFWFAAAGLLGLMVVAGSKRFWQRTSMPVLEGWVYVTSAIVLTVVGAAIDAVGS